jgi:hypothetical protein
MADKRFLPILKNWLQGMRRIKIGNILIASLDQEVDAFLNREGIAYLGIHVEPRINILRTKTEVVYSLLEKGFDVLFSDADAIWLQDPFEYLNSKDRLKYKFLISQAHGHPRDILKQLGFVLCSGFYLVKECNECKLLLREWIKYQDMSDVDSYCDQAAINRMVIEKVHTWNISDPIYWSGIPPQLSGLEQLKHSVKKLIGRSKSQVSSNQLITASFAIESQEIPFGVLPLKAFRRGPCDPFDAPFMVHIGAGGNVDKKIQQIKEHRPNLWFLED